MVGQLMVQLVVQDKPNVLSSVRFIRELTRGRLWTDVFYRVISRHVKTDAVTERPAYHFAKLIYVEGERFFTNTAGFIVKLLLRLLVLRHQKQVAVDMCQLKISVVRLQTVLVCGKRRAYFWTRARTYMLTQNYKVHVCRDHYHLYCKLRLPGDCV